jgi:hypothetical protein
MQLAVDVAQVGVAHRAQLSDVEVGVAALQGIIGPGDQAEALVADCFSLRQLELVADAFVLPFGEHPQLMRAVLELDSGGGLPAATLVGPQEAEDEAHQLPPGEGAQEHPAVVRGRDQHVGGHHVQIL